MRSGLCMILRFLAPVVLLWGAATTASAQCSVGTAIQQGCGQIVYDGCCEDQDLFWCEGGWICFLDCTASPLCGWDDLGPYYNCNTAGSPAPGNNPPMVCATGPVDGDGDGFDESQDCDDDDPWVFPGAQEACDGVDNDCSGVIDDADEDGDGFDGCGGADCDDADPSINPAATEHCADGVDNDCDDHIDGADGDCSGDDDGAGDDDGSGDDDGGGDDDTDEDDDGGSGGPGLGVMCACRAAGGRAAGGAAIPLLLVVFALAHRRTRR